MSGIFRRHPTAVAYALLLPGLLYLLVFYLVPTDPDVPGLALDREHPGRLLAHVQLLRYTPTALAKYWDQFVRSIVYGGWRRS